MTDAREKLRAHLRDLIEKDIPALEVQRDTPGWTPRERRALDRAIAVHKRTAAQLRRTLDPDQSDPQS